jgi:hypothetical protein
MIILKKFSKIIPSFRHKTDIELIDNSYHKFPYIKYHKKNNTVNFIKRKKLLFNGFYYNINLCANSKLNLITKQFVYNFKPYKKITICQTITGITYNLPGIENVNVGKLLLSQKNLQIYSHRFNFKGFISFL